MKHVMINTTADRLQAGMRVKLRTSGRLFTCAAPASSHADRYATITDGQHKWWLSPNFRVQVPLIDDPLLGQPA